MINEIKLNTEQATWLYEIRHDSNFYQSLEIKDRLIVFEILSNRFYDGDVREEINRIRDIWIRYVKLNNNKDI